MVQPWRSGVRRRKAGPGMSEGNKEVDKIMWPLVSHIREGADPKTNRQHYNVIYEVVWKLQAEIADLKTIRQKQAECIVEQEAEIELLKSSNAQIGSVILDMQKECCLHKAKLQTLADKIKLAKNNIAKALKYYHTGSKETAMEMLYIEKNCIKEAIAEQEAGK